MKQNLIATLIALALTVGCVCGIGFWAQAAQSGTVVIGTAEWRGFIDPVTGNLDMSAGVVAAPPAVTAAIDWAAIAPASDNVSYEIGAVNRTESGFSVSVKRTETIVKDAVVQVKF